MAESSGPADAEEFAAWVAPHLLAVQRYAARLVPNSDRDDLVQEVLLRAWRRRATYDPRRGEPLPWLLAIVADRARRHRRGTASAPALIDSDGSADPIGVDVDLGRAVGRLSARQRQAIDLYYFLDLDVETTARTMGCAPGTVRATLHQARAALRDMLGEGHG